MRCLVNALANLVGEEGVRLSVANMVYSNFIACDEPLTSSKLSHYLRGLPEDLMEQESLFHVESSYQGKQGVDLRVRAQAARLNDNKTGFLLTTSGGVVLSGTSIDEAFGSLDRVHKALIFMFDRALTEEACVEWGRRQVENHQ